MGSQDVTSSLMIIVIVFTILLLLVAFQAVHADYYGPRPPPVYRPLTTSRLLANSIAKLFFYPHNALRSRLGSGSSWAPGFAVHSWIVEGSSYNFNTNSCDGSEMCGHYTQIVWRDTKKLECASVVCENGAGVFITCNYDPPGNYVGRETLLRESL
ncbi:hypothetical protein IGI04_040798 [Brassica rapa subsp. trilocularis]|uniref:SCP domain-containing protein n=1 Tax=Brassica rapa subsp. trilocularis TaxID=1813537 RepID=A0ABQ7KPL6_BRACM|nr:hypothetical protein IGI04_040798 [Brassica rapa subsp. trilocularis]